MERDDLKRVKRQLKFIRYLIAYLPLKMMQWLTKKDKDNYTVPEGWIQEKFEVEEVPCQWLIPDSPSEGVIFYLHGGGFVFEASSRQLKMVETLGGMLNLRVLVVHYRLAPKHPFPTALNDCFNVYNWLINQEGESSDNIVFIGDSAGGNLVLTTAMKLRDADKSLPGAIAALSPVGNFTKRDMGDFYDLLLHPRVRKKFDSSYVAESDRTDPYLSPVFGNWNGLPPILIHAGDDEFLKGDAIRIKQEADKSNTNVELKVFDKMWHVWQITPEIPEAKESLDEIAKFFKRHLSK